MGILEEIKDFYNKYDGEKGIIGYSGLNEEIYYFAVKKTNFPVVICQYAIHAREYITSYLALLDIKNFIKNGKVGTVYFIPAVNPDGIRICQNGKPLYKANAFGVDLNVNFDALWGTGKFNVRKSGEENYIGKHPFSESESVAIRDFTLKVKPNGTLSFHSKGEVIYYGFNGIEKEHKKIAQTLSKSTGYKIEVASDSAGGYKDWCIEKLKIPAFTIEVGSDELSHPIGKEYLPTIYEKTKNVVKVFTESL